MVVQPDSPDPKNPMTPKTSDEALREACAQIYDRLGRLESALQRTEGLVADKPWDQSTIAFRRLERIDETLRSMQRSIDDSTLPEMCVNIERQIVQARKVIERTESAISTHSLREIYEDINARLARTEDTLRRTENMVAGWRRDFSESITERAVTTNLTDAAMSWSPRLATPALAAVLAVAIVALIWTSRSAGPAVRSLGPIAASTTAGAVTAPVQAAAVLGPATVAASSEPPAATLVSNVAPASRSDAPAPARRTNSRRTAAAPARAQFVGTLSITSVPSGASVSINGKAAGVTPLRLPRQRAGSMAVQIAQDGFERWSAAVRVPADQLTQVTANLRPLVQE
jgi:hypothetical protein